MVAAPKKNVKTNLIFKQKYDIIIISKRDMTWEEWQIFKEKTHTHSDYFIESIMEEGRGGL